MERGKLAHVKLSLINDEDYLMRSPKDDEAFHELVQSVRRNNILVPLLLKLTGETYTVVAGHRRTRAAVAAGLSEVPAYIFEGAEGPGWDAAFAENMFRQDLSPIEEAAALNDCVEQGGQSVDQLAAAVGKSVNWVLDRLELMNWPGDLSLAVHSGKISVGAAKHLAQITDAAHRSMLVAFAIDNGATARTTAAWLQSFRANVPVVNPSETEPVEGRSALPPIVPFTPCVICARHEEMGRLSYMPVCSACSQVVMSLAVELRKGDGVSDSSNT